MLPAARGTRAAEPGAAEADGSDVGATTGGSVAGGAADGVAGGITGGVTGGVAIELAAGALVAGSEVAGGAGRAAQPKAVAATDIAAPRTNQKTPMT